jgi:hypothetical protein
MTINVENIEPGCLPSSSRVAPDYYKHEYYVNSLVSIEAKLRHRKANERIRDLYDSCTFFNVQHTSESFQTLTML